MPRAGARHSVSFDMADERDRRWVLSDELAARLFKLGTLKLYREGIRPFASCEDLAQECLERCLGHFEPARGTDFKTYYLQALRNAAINHRARHWPIPIDSIPEPSLDDGALVRRRVAVQKALARFRDRLEAQERSILDTALLILAHLDTALTQEGNPHGLGSQGARRTGLSRDQFLRSWDRLRRRLREELDRQLSLTSEDWPDGW